jgi:hypothetical protein
MTDHHDMAADDGAQPNIARQQPHTQQDQHGAKPQEQEPPDRPSTTATRRKAMDGSQLGEPVLDWSGLNLSAQACIRASAAASLSLS